MSRIPLLYNSTSISGLLPHYYFHIHPGECILLISFHRRGNLMLREMLLNGNILATCVS